MTEDEKGTGLVHFPLENLTIGKRLILESVNFVVFSISPVGITIPNSLKEATYFFIPCTVIGCCPRHYIESVRL